MRALAILILALAVAGCQAPRTRYAWGSYEDVIYATEGKPGALAPEAQLEQLEKDRSLAVAANRPLPPGWRAHVATLYAETGRLDRAREELLAEKAAFPEAGVFVDRLLANLAASAAPK